MARAPIAFRTCFETACYVAGNGLPVAGSADETKRLIDFNRTYGVAYAEGGADGWTDARTGDTVTPTDRLIGFDLLGDSRLWEVYDVDPRGNDDAISLGWTENSEGILLNEDADEVWVSWVPESVKFGNTSWAAEAHDYAVGDLRVYATTGHCYRCIVAHSTTTSSVFTTDLAAAKWVLVPVLAVLEEFVYAYTQGLYLIRNGQAQTGYAMQKDALSAVEDVALAEIRNRERGRKPSCSSSAATPPGASSRYLRFDTDQSLSTLQQLQALENAGVTIDADGKLTFPGGAWIYLNAA